MTAEEIKREFPAWHVWQGIAGLWYARRLLSSPPVVFRAHNLTALRERVARWEKEHAR